MIPNPTLYRWKFRPGQRVMKLASVVPAGRSIVKYRYLDLVGIPSTGTIWFQHLGELYFKVDFRGITYYMIYMSIKTQGNPFQAVIKGLLVPTFGRLPPGCWIFIRLAISYLRVPHAHALFPNTGKRRVSCTRNDSAGVARHADMLTTCCLIIR